MLVGSRTGAVVLGLKPSVTWMVVYQDHKVIGKPRIFQRIPRIIAGDFFCSLRARILDLRFWT